MGSSKRLRVTVARHFGPSLLTPLGFPSTALGLLSLAAVAKAKGWRAAASLGRLCGHASMEAAAPLIISRGVGIDSDGDGDGASAQAVGLTGAPSSARTLIVACHLLAGMGSCALSGTPRRPQGRCGTDGSADGKRQAEAEVEAGAATAQSACACLDTCRSWFTLRTPSAVSMTTVRVDSRAEPSCAYLV